MQNYLNKFLVLNSAIVARTEQFKKSSVFLAKTEKIEKIFGMAECHKYQRAGWG